MQNRAKDQAEHAAVNACIRIYVADLAAYNNGFLHGVWIDATEDVDAIHEKIAVMRAASPVAGGEEYAIHDFEGFSSYRVSK
jgi:antirestriction protein